MMSKDQTTAQLDAIEPSAAQLAVSVKVRHTASNKGKPKARSSATCEVQIVKQCLGIDVGKDDLQICFRDQLSDGNLSIKVQKKIPNSPGRLQNDRCYYYQIPLFNST